MNRKLHSIVMSFNNGQNKQMVELIDEYGNYDFWHDLKIYLIANQFADSFDQFTGITIAYNRIKNR